MVQRRERHKLPLHHVPLPTVVCAKEIDCSLNIGAFIKHNARPHPIMPAATALGHNTVRPQHQDCIGDARIHADASFAAAPFRFRKYHFCFIATPV